ncbi:MAG: DUF1761 domain-containing protein [Terracidiphilus sp.]|jgi:hypothetical protein
MVHQHVNHLAILVAALIQWVLGAFWYSVAFGKLWRSLVGQKNGSTASSAAVAMISSFIGGLFTSFILAHVILWSEATNFPWGSFIGFMCWLGFVAPLLFAQTLFEKRSYLLFAINVSYWLFVFVITGGLLAQWQ